jgi:hypothetical protein
LNCNNPKTKASSWDIVRGHCTSMACFQASHILDGCRLSWNLLPNYRSCHWLIFSDVGVRNNLFMANTQQPIWSQFSTHIHTHSSWDNKRSRVTVFFQVHSRYELKLQMLFFLHNNYCIVQPLHCCAIQILRLDIHSTNIQSKMYINWSWANTSIKLFARCGYARLSWIDYSINLASK